MSVLVGKSTRLVVQGMTGSAGAFHARQMREYGTQVVAGVTPGRGGSKAVDDRVPVFDTVVEAVEATGANAAVVFVPPPFAADAIIESIAAEVPLVVRLEGTNVELGKKILAESGLNVVNAADMADGARKIVELAGRKS